MGVVNEVLEVFRVGFCVLFGNVDDNYLAAVSGHVFHPHTCSIGNQVPSKSILHFWKTII